MIYERISELGQHPSICANLQKAVGFLRETKLDQLPAGRVEISGDTIWGTVIERSVSDAPTLWEAHRSHIDIHVLLEGGERIGCIEGASAAEGAYNEESDALVTDQPLHGNEICMEKGYAAVIFPNEFHQPMIPAVPGGHIKKIVVKVLCEQQVNKF